MFHQIGNLERCVLPSAHVLNPEAYRFKPYTCKATESKQKRACMERDTKATKFRRRRRDKGLCTVQVASTAKLYRFHSSLCDSTEGILPDFRSPFYLFAEF